MRRREFLGLGVQAAALAGTTWGGARAALAQTHSRAWVGATLWTGDGQIIEDATLVTAGDRIVAVAQGAPVPAGADVAQAHGMILTPGWIAVETALGLVEIELESATVDARPLSEEPLHPIHAAYSAADGFNPTSALLSVARREGVTSALVTPQGGLVSGTSTWVDLLDRFPGPAVVREDVALHANLFEWGQFNRPMALAHLRDALESARLYAQSPQAYDRGQTRDLQLSPLELRRLSQIIGGQLPLVVRVARGSDILRLLEMAGAFQLRLVLSGAAEGWTVAAQIAAARVPVVVDPLENLPAAFSRLKATKENAARLSAAGVPLLFSSFDPYRLHTLRQLAGNAVASGVSRSAAVRALAFEAAQAFGMSAHYGLLAPGRLANLCLWNGDPFELGTWPVDVVIGGRSMSTRSRQTELFERYRDLKSLPRGRAGLLPGAR